MRWTILPLAGLLLVPATGYAADVAASGPEFAQAAPARPATSPATQRADERSFLVFFDWDKATLTNEARRIVADAAAEYKRSGATRITATGHTDTSGSAQYNMRLSIRRAEAVKAELVRLGVPANVITTVGRGQEDLLVPTRDGVREPQNRRVLIEIPVPPKAPIAAAPAPAPTPAAAPPPPPPPPMWAVSLGPWYGYSIKETDRGGNDKDAHLVGGNLELAYYPTPAFGINLEQAGFNTVGTSSNDGWGGRSAIGLDLVGPFGGFNPYIGANFGGYYGAGVQDGLFAGPEIGAKFDLSRQWFLFAKAGYDFLFTRNDWDEGVANGSLGGGYRF